MTFILAALLAVALTCGPVTIILGYRLYKKYKSNSLSAYLLYLVLFTAFGFFGYIVQAVSWEILGKHMFITPAVKTLTSVLDVVAGPLIITALYGFILFCRRQVEKKTPALFATAYFLSCFLLMTTLLGSALTGMTEFFPPFPPGSVVGLITVYIAILPVLPGLKKIKDKDRRKSLRIIYFMYLALFNFYFILSFFMKGHHFILHTFFALHFVINFPPLLYMRKYLKESDLIPPAEFRDESEMERIFSEYGLSPREREIAYMVLQGKSNPEIEAELFISINTVKNHISKIYQKFDVTNRLRFTNFLKNLIDGRRI